RRGHAHPAFHRHRGARRDHPGEEDRAAALPPRRPARSRPRDRAVHHPAVGSRQLKQELVKLGWPAEDLAGYTPGTPHPIDLIEDDWHLRGYQNQAIDNFFVGGSGVVVLPCGAGKTLVGAGAMATAKTNTLILVTNTVSARQWRSELLRRTSLTEDEI